MEFGLFYFANDSESSDDRYRMLLTGAKFADTHGFSAVWTPERHFHAFGGSYPNPAVVGAVLHLGDHATPSSTHTRSTGSRNQTR